MIISTENDNFSLTILLPGKENTPPTSNVNITVVDSNDDSRKRKNNNNISTMMVTCSGTILYDSDEFPRRSASPMLSVHRKDFESMEHNSSLMQGLNALRESGQLLDVTLWAENRPFQAHRAVLAACSDYFRAMFTDPMRERLQADIYLAGVSAKGLSAVLEYIYTSRVSLSLQNIHSVLSAASHLQVLQVLEACSTYLMAQLDLANCIAILDLSESFGLYRLRQATYRYISESLSLVSANDLMSLSFDQMETLLSSDFPVDVAEIDILELVLTWVSKESSRIEKMSEKLLQKINFDQILFEDMTGLSKKLAAANVLPQAFLTKVLALKSVNSDNNVGADVIRGRSRGIINFRGMELAILKIGGFTNQGVTNELSYFLTGSEKWHHLTRIPHIECSNFGCAVVDNELYVIGGCFNQTHSLANFQEQAHPFGYRYNPRLHQWSSIAPMMRERCRFSLTSVGKILFATGGSEGSSDDLDEHFDVDGQRLIEDVTAEEYIIDQDLWRPMPDLPGGALTRHASVGFQNKFLLVSGGLDRNHQVQDSFLAYSLQSRTWEPLGWRRLPTPRADHVMLEYNNRILVVGGWYYEDGDQLNDQRSLVATIDSYDVTADVWSVETQIPKPKFHSGVALVRDKIFIIGGCLSDIFFERSSGTVECYDLVLRRWTQEKNYPQDIWEHICLPIYIPRGNGKEIL